MKWFDGEVAEAIAESRRKKLLFVVAVLHSPESSNENTEKMIKLWDAIDEGFCEETMVAIRIYHGSEQSQQFSQIYPLPIVPSSYIIDLSGQPLDVITINESMDDVVFMSHLRSACEAAHLGDRIKAKNVASSSSSSKQVDSAESGDSKTQRPKEEATELNENSSDAMAAEEKAKRARELLKQKHAAEEERKKKEELEKEMERRNMGKLLSEAKSAREEKEIRELAEKRRRDKIEAEQQLRRLREQIKADREERQRRNAPEANVCGMNKSDENKPLLQQPIPSSECRIQCKFPDGSTLVHQFASSSKFSELIELIKQDGRQKEEFYLVQMYPRREFPDSNSSFLELGLTPSATILVVTRHSSKNTAVLSQSGSGVMNLLQYLLVSPFQFFFNFVSSLFGYLTPTTTNQPAASVPSTASHQKNDSSNPNQSSTRKQDGDNIHRFHNEHDEEGDDDEARWNGNSTQQL